MTDRLASRVVGSLVPSRTISPTANRHIQTRPKSTGNHHTGHSEQGWQPVRAMEEEEEEEEDPSKHRQADAAAWFPASPFPENQSIDGWIDRSIDRWVQKTTAWVRGASDGAGDGPIHRATQRGRLGPTGRNKKRKREGKDS